MSETTLLDALMRYVGLTEQQARQAINVMQTFNLEQLAKWRRNLLKLRGQEAEECYRLLKELKPTERNEAYEQLESLLLKMITEAKPPASNVQEKDKHGT